MWYACARDERHNFKLHGGHLRLVKLVNIASCPHLAKHVKSLSLGLGCLLGCEHMDCDENFHHYRQINVFGYEVGVRDLQPAVQRYLHHVQNAIRFASPKLRNLQGIRILAEYRRILADYQRYNNHDSVSYSLFLRNRLINMVHAVLNHFSHPTRNGLLRRWILSLPSLCDLGIYLKASMLRNVMCNLHTLSLMADEEPWYRIDISSQDIARAEAVLKHLLRLASCVRILRVTPGHFNNPRINLDFDSIVSMPLENLYLNNVKEWRAPDDEDIANSTAREPGERGGMHTLTLIHIVTSSERLLQILHSNAATLDRIHFNSVGLTSGTWTTIFTCMCHKLQALSSIVTSQLYYDPSGSSADLAVGENDPIIQGPHCYDLNSADLAEFGLLEPLHNVVAERATLDGHSVCSDRLWKVEAPPVFGPEKRHHTLLNKWLSLEAM